MTTSNQIMTHTRKTMTQGKFIETPPHPFPRKILLCLCVHLPKSCYFDVYICMIIEDIIVTYLIQSILGNLSFVRSLQTVFFFWVLCIHLPNDDDTNVSKWSYTSPCELKFFFVSYIVSISSKTVQVFI